MHDPRLDTLRAFAEDACVRDPSLRAAYPQLGEILDELAGQRRRWHIVEDRIDKISNVLCNLATLNFDARVDIHRDGSELDGIAAYVNMLSEELQERVEEQKRVEEELEERVKERTREVTVANRRLQESLDELRTAQRQLIDASRRAGMSDIATSVLHNVGNVLNSVNVSATVLGDGIDRSCTRSLRRISELLQQHVDDLPGFLSTDPVGKRLPEYIEKLDAAAERERNQLREEVASLQKYIDHIKVIVSLQQTHARGQYGLTEKFSWNNIVTDAIDLIGDSLKRHQIETACNFPEAEITSIGDRHVLMQVVTNLLANARDAVRGAEERKIVVTLRPTQSRVCLEIRDTGCGIAPEHLDRIFTYGFTTKPDGHGFGLHSAACAIGELGGRLSVHSDGVGKGATFRMEVQR